MTRALALLALAVAGHACALRLIDVRPYAVFQHFQPWSLLWTTSAWATAGLVLQSAVVLPLAWRAPTLARLARAIPLRAWIVVVMLVGFALAVPAVSVMRYAGEVLLAAGIAFVAALNLALVALAVDDRMLSRLATWVDARVTVRPNDDAIRGWDRALPVVIALWVTVAASLISVIVLEGLPHIDDSISNLFQAKYFATGRLFLPAPPDTDAFRMDLTVIDGGKWFGYAFPGWPAVLSLGVLAGVPWLVNPVLGGLLVLVAHAWIRGRWDRGTANVALLLLGSSSWLIFTSAEMMGHPLTALLVMVALWGWDRGTSSVFLAGLATGGVLLTRSFDGLLLIVSLGAMTLIDGRLVRAWRQIALAAAAAVLVGGLIFPYNQAVTGRATYPAHEAWADGRYGPGVDVIGFGPNVGIDRWPNLDPLPGHGPADVVLNANKNAFMVNVDLFGWPTGSLVLIALAFGLSRWRRADVPSLVLVGVYLAGYSLFWFSGGPDLGARYWYPLLVPFAVMAVRAVQMTGAARTTGVRVGVAVAAAALSALAVMLPWRAVTKHHGYRGISGQVRALAESHAFGRALVFVRVGDRGGYQSAFVLNPPTLDGDGPIYAHDVGPASRAAVVSSFRDRPVWLIGRRTAEDGSHPWAVLAGPLEPGEVPR